MKSTRKALPHVDAHQLTLFWARVEIARDGCWQWIGQRRDDGYGIINYPPRRYARAHRWSYEAFVADIPKSLVIDHLCRNRGCVNPDHLEPVTDQENIRRGEVGLNFRVAAAAITECPGGHAYDSVNTYIDNRGYRHCRKCDVLRNAQDRTCPSCGLVRASRTVNQHLQFGCPDPNDRRSYRQQGKRRTRLVTEWTEAPDA